MRKLCILLAALSALVSCGTEDDVLYYGGRSMAEVSSGSLLTDNGQIFNVTEQLCQGQIDTMSRVFIYYDVLKKTDGGQSNEYDIRLRQLYPALKKAYVPVSTDLTNDPVSPDLVWESGGYLNMGISFERRLGSTRAHTLDLGYDEAKSTSDSLFFHIFHNSFGESYFRDPEAKDLYSGGAYVSFDIKGLLSGKESAVITIFWNGYDLSSSESVATKEYKFEGLWKK